MSKPIQIQIIEEARSLIQDEKQWCRGELAFDIYGAPVCPTGPTASKWCAYGALVAVSHRMAGDTSRAFDLADVAAKHFGGSDAIMKVNDKQGHAAVLALLDEVIRRSP